MHLSRGDIASIQHPHKPDQDLYFLVKAAHTARRGNETLDYASCVMMDSPDVNLYPVASGYTTSDWVVYPDEGPDIMVIQTDLHAALKVERLKEVIGRVNESTLDAINDMIDSDEPDPRRGWTDVAESDDLWTWKAEQGTLLGRTQDAWKIIAFMEGG